MGIFKEHSYDIVKLYVNQIGITIFSLFLYTAVGAIEDNSLFTTLRIIVSVFSILFYFILVYNVVWEIGAKDRIRIDSNGYEPKPLKGAVMGLFANVPNLVFAALSVAFVAIFLLSGAKWAVSPFLVFFTIVKFHAAMYMGVAQGSSPASPADIADIASFNDALLESVWFIVFALAAILVTQLSYWLGTKEIRVFGFLSSRSDKDKK